MEGVYPMGKALLMSDPDHEFNHQVLARDKERAAVLDFIEFLNQIWWLYPLDKDFFDFWATIQTAAIYSASPTEFLEIKRRIAEILIARIADNKLQLLSNRANAGL